MSHTSGWALIPMFGEKMNYKLGKRRVFWTRLNSLVALMAAWSCESAYGGILASLWFLHWTRKSLVVSYKKRKTLIKEFVFFCGKNRHVLWMVFSNGDSTSKQYFVFPWNGLNYCVMYIIKASHVLVILQPGMFLFLAVLPFSHLPIFLHPACVVHVYARCFDITMYS